MTDNERITCVCTNCGYTNVWTRDEILQRGEEVVYRGEKEEIFILPCKNPQIACPQRTRVGVTVTNK